MKRAFSVIAPTYRAVGNRYEAVGTDSHLYNRRRGALRVESGAEAALSSRRP